MAIAAAVIMTAPAAAKVSAQQAAVEAVMLDSAEGWNAGQIDRFMRVYSDRPETSFVTSNGLVRGKAAMTARYRTRYSLDDPAKRGILTFSTLDFRVLDPTHVLYIGQYLLTYPSGKTETGPTTLIFAHEKTGWKIIADHSS